MCVMAPLDKLIGDLALNDDNVGQQILLELRDTKSDIRQLTTAQGSLNAEVIRLQVKVEQLSSLQQTAMEHNQRIAALESAIANQDKFGQRLADQTRWLIVLAVTSFISLAGLIIQIMRAAPLK